MLNSITFVMHSCYAWRHRRDTPFARYSLYTVHKYFLCWSRGCTRKKHIPYCCVSTMYSRLSGQTRHLATHSSFVSIVVGIVIELVKIRYIVDGKQPRIGALLTTEEFRLHCHVTLVMCTVSRLWCQRFRVSIPRYVLYLYIEF